MNCGRRSFRTRRTALRRAAGCCCAIQTLPTSLPRWESELYFMHVCALCGLQGVVMLPWFTWAVNCARACAQMPYWLSRRGAQQLLSPNGRPGRTLLLQEGWWWTCDVCGKPCASCIDLFPIASRTDDVGIRWPRQLSPSFTYITLLFGLLRSQCLIILLVVSRCTWKWSLWCVWCYLFGVEYCVSLCDRKLATSG